MNLLQNEEVINNVKLLRQKLTCANVHSDGRKNSAIDDEDAKAIWKTFGDAYGIGGDRDFYDLKYTSSDGEDHFINFKTTVLRAKTNDNLNAKAGLLLAFTDVPVSKISLMSSSYKKIINCLVENKADISRDYYYIVFDKQSDKYLFTSMRNLDNLVPNGNNPPFQCKWALHDPTKNLSRTFDDSRNYVLSQFQKSLEKRAEAYIHLTGKHNGQF